MKEGVCVRNLSFSHGKVDILRNVSLCVFQSHIYCLLGPSGCGKTTLLRCIVGRLNPGEGDVSIFGYGLGHACLRIPGYDVGYMPQEYALYDNLSVRENITHFSKINQVPESQIKSRCVELSTMFDLPEGDPLVRNLSGGQRRRVSLICCLVHHPRLAILDEPTAGIDPILCKKIWSHLEWISKWQKTTVIITTHYIEEARRANCIGFMRKGRLMVENSPEILMETYRKKTLEDTFLHLCQMRRKSTMTTAKDVMDFREQRARSRAKSKEIEKHGKHESEYRSHLIKSWLKTFFTLIKTSIWMESRDPLCLMFQYVIPLVMLSLVYFCFGRTPVGIKIGYVNDDFNFFVPWLSLGREFVETIDDRLFSKTKYYNLTDAYPDLRSGKLWAVLAIPYGFGRAWAERPELNATDRSINKSLITLYADMSDQIVALTCTRSLENYFLEWERKELLDFEKNTKSADPYIMIIDPVYGKYKKDDYTGYQKYAFPGFLLNSTLAIAMAISSISLISLKRSQAIERTLVCGVTTGQLLLSHALARWILNISYAVMMAYASSLFEPQYPEMMGYAVVLIFFVVLCGTAFGMILSAVFNEMSAAIYAISAIFILLLFTTGCLWPIQSIPYGFRWISHSLPITGSTEAYRSALYRGWSLFHPFIWPKLACEVLWFVNLIFLSYFLTRRAI